MTFLWDCTSVDAINANLDTSQLIAPPVVVLFCSKNGSGERNLFEVRDRENYSDNFHVELLCCGHLLIMGLLVAARLCFSEAGAELTRQAISNRQGPGAGGEGIHG